MRRRIHYGDVAAVTRAVLMLEPDCRAAACHRMYREAQTADAHRRETGRAHPLWGSGTLIEVARQRPLSPERGFDDPDYCAAMQTVLECLIANGVSPSRS